MKVEPVMEVATTVVLGREAAAQSQVAVAVARAAVADATFVYLVPVTEAAGILLMAPAGETPILPVMLRTAPSVSVILIYERMAILAVPVPNLRG